MKERKNKKVIKFQKPSQLNIGIIFFVIIFIYFLYYVITFFTTEHISVYEVNQGTIAQDTIFKGLILRDENIYYAQDTGYINYYCKDGSKANVGKYIYSVDANGNFYNQMVAANDGKLLISDEAYDELESVAEQYMSSYSDHNFYQIYQFKYDMEATLVEALHSSVNEEIINSISTGENANLHAYTTDAAGIVVYYTDGYENINVDNFTADMMVSRSYEKENLLKREKINVGEPVYKIINSEIWNVVVPVDSSLAKDLENEKNIKVEFKKDNSSAWASSQIITRDGKPFLVLQFNNSMIRFAQDRYIELELLLTDTSGLKIPNSAITKKEFITIPKDYLTKGGDSNNNGLLVEYLSDNKKVTEFREVSVFYETEDVYYIDGKDIKLGDVVVKPASNQRYTLQNTKELDGVFNINKGYAVFKRIEKLFENEEYTIIKTGTSYGIALYDHIALDGTSVQENDIVH